MTGHTVKKSSTNSLKTPSKLPKARITNEICRPTSATGRDTLFSLCKTPRANEPSETRLND